MRNYCSRACAVILLTAACRSGGPVHVYTFWGATTERLPVGSAFDWWPAGETPHHVDPGIVRLVQDTVEMELEAMGYAKRSPESKADFHVSVQYGRGFQPTSSGPEQRAGLVVDMYDATDEHLIFRAWADAAADPTLAPEERKARIQRAVREILRPFAPR